MKTKTKLAAAIATVALLGSVAANAALMNGYSDASFNTSVFVSVVERSATNQIVRNLVIDTGARALDTFASSSWSTTAAQEAEILNFIATKGTGNTVRFNVGGALNELSYATDLQGFVTSGNLPGPAPDQLSALAQASENVSFFIENANNGVFNANGVLTATSNIQPGWHGYATWGNDVGGAATNNELLLGGNPSQLTAWRINLDTAAVDRFNLGALTSNVSTGDISFGVVPVPAAVWMLGSAVALLAAVRRRVAA
jgi:hypothetical protein